jgi:dCMP deaminase
MKSQRKRPSRDEYYLRMAHLVSERGTCFRRQVGCVLVNGMGHMLSTGYNGRPAGMPHCIDSPCKGDHSVSGGNLDSCEAVHAEQNALIQCPDPNQIVTAYITVSPCISCVKLLMTTGCSRIVTYELYPGYSKVKDFWTLSAPHRKFIFIPPTKISGLHLDN